MPRKHPIQVVDYDPTWPESFGLLCAKIWPAVRDVADTIEHVGSTSVVGLAAKPIIDMTIVLGDASKMSDVITRLTDLGYEHRGDQGVPGREAFRKPDATPAHNLYACVTGNLGLRNHLAIRDHLRRHPEDVQAYGDLKKQLAERFPRDIEAYVDGKTDLLVGILEKADFTREEIDEIRGINEQ